MFGKVMWQQIFLGGGSRKKLVGLVSPAYFAVFALNIG